MSDEKYAGLRFPDGKGGYTYTMQPYDKWTRMTPAERLKVANRFAVNRRDKEPTVTEEEGAKEAGVSLAAFDAMRAEQRLMFAERALDKKRAALAAEKAKAAQSDGD